MSYGLHPRQSAYGFPTDRAVPEARESQMASNPHPPMTHHAQYSSPASSQQRLTRVLEPAQTVSQRLFGAPMDSVATHDTSFVPNTPIPGPSSFFLPSDATMSETREDFTQMDLDLSDQADQADRNHMFQPVTYQSMSYTASNGVNELLAMTPSCTNITGDQAMQTFPDCSISNSAAFDGRPNFVDGSNSHILPEASQWDTSRPTAVGPLPRQNRDSGLPSSSNSSDALNKQLPPVRPPQTPLDYSTIAACSSWLGKYGGSTPSKSTMEHLSLAFDVPYDAVYDWFSSQIATSFKCERPSERSGSDFATTAISGRHPISNICPLKRRCKRVASAKSNADENLGRFHWNDKPLYVCTTCHFPFATKAGWKRHEKIKWPQTLWLCQYPACQTTLRNRGYFSRKHGLKEHYLKVHLITCSQQDLSSYEHAIGLHFDEPCIFKLCPQRFSTWDEWIEHVGGHFEFDIWDVSQWRSVEEDGEQASDSSSADLSGGEGRSEHDDNDPGSSYPGHAPGGMPRGRSGDRGSGFSGPSTSQGQHEGHSGNTFGGPKGSQLDLHTLTEKLAGIDGSGDDITRRTVLGSDGPIREHLTSRTHQAVPNLSLTCQPMIVSAQRRFRAKLESKRLLNIDGNAQSANNHHVHIDKYTTCKDITIYRSLSLGDQVIYAILSWIAARDRALTGRALLYKIIVHKSGFLKAGSDMQYWQKTVKPQRSHANARTEDVPAIIAKGAHPFHIRPNSSFQPYSFECSSLLSILCFTPIEVIYTAAYGYQLMPAKFGQYQETGAEPTPYMRILTQPSRVEMNRNSGSVLGESGRKEYRRPKPRINDPYFTRRTCTLTTAKLLPKMSTIVLTTSAFPNRGFSEGLQNNTRDQKTKGEHRARKKIIKDEPAGGKEKTYTNDESETSGMLPMISDDSTMSDVSSVSTSSLRVLNGDVKAGQGVRGSQPATAKAKSARPDIQKSQPIVTKAKLHRPSLNTYGLPLVSMLKEYLKSDEDNNLSCFVTGKPRKHDGQKLSTR